MQNDNDGMDSLSHADVDIMRVNPKYHSGKRKDEISESDTQFIKMGVDEFHRGQQSVRTDDEQSDVHFKIDYDLQSSHSHIFNEDELQQYEDHI